MNATSMGRCFKRLCTSLMWSAGTGGIENVWAHDIKVDAGNAADRWADMHAVLGLGVGLRWRSPVGPLKIDVAWGQAVQQVRLHVGVGIVF